VLTENARSLLFPESKESGYDRQGRPVEVIPCCVDFKSRFPEINGDRATAKQGLGLEDRFVIVHLGALGGLYMTEEIADFLATARREDQATFALFLTQTDPNRIIPLLKERGFSESDYLVTRVDPADVQKYLLASDVALSFVKAGYDTASRSPTKIPEYLACGLPVIANSGVGDVDGMLIHNCVGVLVNEFTNEGYGAAFEAVSKLGGVRETCRETAIREFDLLSVGGERYMRIYERVMK
jgi:glycosyltransferase involved in cell wall biosynthesis